MRICEYGCGSEAKYQFKNGKWCCSSNANKCIFIRNKQKGKKSSEETKRKISEYRKGKILSIETKRKIGSSNTGKKRTEEHNKRNGDIHRGKKLSKETKKKISDYRKGKKLSKETKKKISINKKITIEQIEKRYPIFTIEEEFRYNPNKPGEKEIQVHCKNHNCKNSKESNGWFTPTRLQIDNRISSLDRYGEGNSYLYCSKECKYDCKLFNKNIQQIIKQDQIKAEYYTSDEKQTFNEEVFKRADDLCEYCGQKSEHVHHSRPQKLEPFFSLDPDFGIACCIECHYKYGHKDECSTGKLAATICR